MAGDLVLQVVEQLHRKLKSGAKGSSIIGHNLEKGLSNEQILRDLLADFLPRKYGVAKGKIANSQGTTSRHCDLIIFDRMKCPTLFLDENRNQILPVEGVYGVYEIKTTLTTVFLEDAFRTLKSVHKIIEDRPNRSTNDFVDIFPPELAVLAFRSTCKLSTLEKHYRRLSRKFPSNLSYTSYSTKSPGFKHHTEKHFLVSSIEVFDRGTVHHMYDGSIRISEYGRYTIGVFLTGLLCQFVQVDLPELDLLGYFNWLKAEAALKADRNRSGKKRRKQPTKESNRRPKGCG